ncbi:protein kinase domain-containing protein [Streptomyces sp. NRRL WC-3549]|uniref:serine/threonine-protein kinase n=1 Tax=Streptomyces sp. NRRL WC-3549 TaxID=1463925 RepID=UPI00068E0BCB|nr:protein kinase [Streptomyces sp. NRRL WC-3549]
MLHPLLHDDPPHVGSYRLTARLGSGGMGTVYLARSPGGRTVALKTVHARIASDATFRTRFRLEVDAARVIGGQHGAQVFDADPLAETPWLATEYVLGPPLDEAVSRCGPLPEAAVRAVGAALCGALGQLHRSDVVHRDLKPSNVMISAYGPKVIDFGIARAVGDDRLTRTGTAAGTPAYMSPEQASGQEQTPAGDVFALAGVLVFAATGRGPFGSGQPADLIYRVRYADPDLTGVPPSLAPVLTRCLAKDPALRPSTAQLVAELHDGRGQFADHLPAGLLSEIARLSAEVWRSRPQRLPAPPEQASHLPETPAPRRTGMSRRRLLTATGLSVAGVGAGAWFWPYLPDGWRLGAADATETGGKIQVPLDLVWTNDSAEAQDYAVPFFVGDTPVVMGEYFQLVGMDPGTGEKLWDSMPLEPHARFVADESDVYCLLSDAWKGLQIRSLDQVTGGSGRTLITLPDIPALSSSHTVAALIDASEGMLHLAVGRDSAPDTDDWRLLALDTKTGKVLWHVPYKGTNDPRFDGRNWFAKTIGNVWVLGQMMSSSILHGYDKRSGEHLWTTKVSDTTAISDGAQLAEDGTHLYVGAGLLRAIRVSDGTFVWEFGNSRDFGDVGELEAHYGAPTVRGEVVYAAESSGTIVAVDARYGELIWETPSPEDNRALLAAPPVLSSDHLSYEGEAGLGAINLSTKKYVRTQKGSLSLFAVSPDKHLLVGIGEERVQGLRLD